MQNHLFLTGEIQVGKSTLIKKFLQVYPNDVDGFRTVSQRTPKNNTVFLENIAGTEKHMIAQFSPIERIVYESVFVEQGVSYIEQSFLGTGITLMDEIGFMEQQILPFTSTVLKRLDHPKPILGVVRKQDNPFISEIKAHPKVAVLEVTLQNRDILLNNLIKFFKSYS